MKKLFQDDAHRHRKQVPSSSSSLAAPSSQSLTSSKLEKQKRFCRVPAPVSQSEQRRVGLDLRDSSLITGTGNNRSQAGNTEVIPFQTMSEASCFTSSFLIAVLTWQLLAQLETPFPRIPCSCMWPKGYEQNVGIMLRVQVPGPLQLTDKSPGWSD